MLITDLLHGFFCKARKGLAPEVILAQGEVGSEQAPAHGAVGQKGNAQLPAGWNQIPLQAQSAAIQPCLLHPGVLPKLQQAWQLVCKFRRQVIKPTACMNARHMSFESSELRHTHVC